MTRITIPELATYFIVSMKNKDGVRQYAIAEPRNTHSSLGINALFGRDTPFPNWPTWTEDPKKATRFASYQDAMEDTSPWVESLGRNAWIHLKDVDIIMVQSNIFVHSTIEAQPLIDRAVTKENQRLLIRTQQELEKIANREKELLDLRLKKQEEIAIYST
jgi:hypothetical protein